LDDSAYLLRQQYRTDANLGARGRLHDLYSTNREPGWFAWVFDHLAELSATAHVLEVGCGPGWLWRANAERVPVGWRLLLTDFSAGMIESARTNLAGLGQAQFEVADVQALPFGDASFDGLHVTKSQGLFLARP
jgi:ubiquinone/menaquinone biosynthesis C-methylase UbiE